MSTELIEAPNGQHAVARRATVMGSLAERYSMDPGKLLDTIKATCIKGNATNEQVQAFLIVANRYGLDPFLKQIHAFAGQGGGIVPIVGIDGWTKIVNGESGYDGCQFQEWRSEQEYHVWQQMKRAKEDGDNDLLVELRKLYMEVVRAIAGNAEPVSMTCRMFAKDREQAVEVTEWLTECKRNTPAWNTMKRRMLRHKSFMQAGRLAFGLGGIYDEDEARDILDNTAHATTTRAMKSLNEKITVAKELPAPEKTAELPAEVGTPADTAVDATESPDVPDVVDEQAPETRVMPDPCPLAWINDQITMLRPERLTAHAARKAFHSLDVETWDKLPRDRQELKYEALASAAFPWPGMPAEKPI